jgi:hypothetical protein
VDQYTTQELEALVNACPNIEELGINLFKLNFDTADALQAFHICDPSKLTAEGDEVAELLVGSYSHTLPNVAY